VLRRAASGLGCRRPSLPAAVRYVIFSFFYQITVPCFLVRVYGALVDISDEHFLFCVFFWGCFAPSVLGYAALPVLLFSFF
jgi:hypothetical protein